MNTNLHWLVRQYKQYDSVGQVSYGNEVLDFQKPQVQTREGRVLSSEKQKNLLGSDFLEIAAPDIKYAKYSFVDKDAAASFLNSTGKSFGDFGTWHAAFPVLKQASTDVVCFPGERTKSFPELLASLGLKMNVSSIKDQFVFSKRLGSLLNHFGGVPMQRLRFLKSKVIREEYGQPWIESTVEAEDGTQFSILERPLIEGKHVADGVLLMGERWDAYFRGGAGPMQGANTRVMTSRGQYKGNSVVMPTGWLDYDLVLIGAKRELQLTEDWLYYGEMPSLHQSSGVFTDVQSVINFWLTDFCVPWADRNLDAAWKSGTDKSSVLRQIQKLANVAKKQGHERSDMVLADLQLLNEKYETGIDLSMFPRTANAVIAGLVSGLCRMAGCVWTGSGEVLPTEDVLEQNSPNVRIALDPKLFLRRYMTVDPSIYLPNGDEDLSRSVLGPGEICVPGLDGYCAAWRQPNGPNEWNLLKAVSGTYLDAYQASPYMFLSPLSSRNARADFSQIKSHFGGCDWDDSCIMSFNPDVVRHFLSLPVWTASPIPLQK